MTSLTGDKTEDCRKVNVKPRDLAIDIREDDPHQRFKSSSEKSRKRLVKKDKIKLEKTHGERENQLRVRASTTGDFWACERTTSCSFSLR